MNTLVSYIHNSIISKAAIYQAIVEKAHKSAPDEASRILTGELEMFESRLNEYLASPKNQGATISEIQGANIFLDVMEMGLSFSRIDKHVYLSRLPGTGSSIGYKVTKEGAIYLAQSAGAIDHLSEAILVQKGEKFSISNTPTGYQIANHTEYFDNKPPFKLENMLVGYVYVVYPNGDRELSRISGERLKELRKKSKNPEMYDDESFIETKIVKHALRSIRISSAPTRKMEAGDDDEYESTEAVPSPTAEAAQYAHPQVQQFIPQHTQMFAPQAPQFPPQQVSPTQQPQYLPPQPVKQFADPF